MRKLWQKITARQVTPGAIVPGSKGGLAQVLISGSAAMTAEDRQALDMRRRLSPVMVEVTLRGAAAGEPEYVDTMYSMMIRSWPRLAGNIRKLRDAAASAPWTVQPWTDNDGETPPEAEERADLVRRVLHGMRPRPGTLEMNWEDTRRYLAEAAVRGTGVAEMLWHVTDDGAGQMTSIRAARPVHASYYAWRCTGTRSDNGSSAEDRLLFRPGGRRGGSWSALTDWPEHQFLVQLSPAWNDHPAVSGLLGTLAVWWIAATYGPQWLMNFAQLFGLPFRWANFPNGDATARDVVAGMLANLGSAGWAALPEGTTLHLQEAAKNAGELPQRLIIDMADTVCDVLLLGQTLTTDTKGVGSQALGNVHEGVGMDIMRAICGRVCGTVTDQLVTPALILNYGDTRFSPSICHGLKDPVDELKMAQTDALHLANGAQLTREYYYKRYNIPLPAKEDELLKPAAKEADKPNDEARKPNDEKEEEEQGEEGEAGVRSAQAAAGLDGESLEELTDIFHQASKAAAAIGWEQAGRQMEQPSPEDSAQP